MNLNLLHVIIFVFSSYICLGQNQNLLDSLSRELQISNDEIQMVEILNELSFLQLHSNSDRADSLAKRAYVLASKHNYLEGQAHSLTRQGSVQMLEQNYAQAHLFLQDALSLWSNIGNPSREASLNNNLGLNEFYQSNDAKAIEFYLKGLESLKDTTDKKLEASILTNMSESYLYLDDLETAIKTLNKVIVIQEDLNDPESKAHSLYTLGNWHFQIGNYQKAKQLFKTSLDLYAKLQNQTGRAKAYIALGNTAFALEKNNLAFDFFANALFLKNFLDPIDLALAIQSIGVLHKTLNKPKKALDAFLESLDGLKKANNSSNIALVQYNIGLLYKSQSMYDKALNFLLDGKKTLDSLDNPVLSMSLFENLSDVYALLNESKLALQYSREHNALQDTLNTRYQNATNYKLNFDEQRQEVALLKKEQEIVLLENNRQYLLIIALVVGGILWLLLSFASLLAYLNKHKREKAEKEMQIAEQDRLLAEQATRNAYREIDDLLHNQELKISLAKLNGQEKERVRIAQDLHDRVGSILSTVKLYFTGFEEKVNSKLSDFQVAQQQQQIKANELLDKAVAEVRAIAQDINSGILTNFGLTAELNALSNVLKDSNKIHMEVVTHGIEKRLPGSLEVNLYRIIQESVSNVIKHAKASEVVVQVNQFKDFVNLIVQDNGKGFDPKVGQEKGGMGLKNLESRVYEMHGTILIESEEGHGTTVIVDIPYETTALSLS